MLEDEGVEDGFGDAFLFRVEGGERFELETEVVVGPAGILAEDELVAGDGARGRGGG